MTLIRTVLALVVPLLVFSANAFAGGVSAAEKTFMWQAQGGEATVYIVGSIHALREEAYPLPPAMNAAFNEAEVVVFEVDMDDMTKAALLMMAAGTLDQGQTLEKVVGPELWFEFQVHCGWLSLDPQFFNGMKPWMAAVTLTAMELTKNGYLGTAGLDSHFSLRAEETGKDRLALETAEFQVSLFTDLDAEQSLTFFRYTLEDLEVMIPEMEKMYVDWRSGNVKGMEQWLLEGFEEFPGLFKKMVIDRNHAWMPRIVELLEGQRDAMVVVGSMHLVGKEGIVALLRQKGYSVTQQ